MWRCHCLRWTRRNQQPNEQQLALTASNPTKALPCKLSLRCALMFVSTFIGISDSTLTQLSISLDIHSAQPGVYSQRFLVDPHRVVPPSLRF